MIPNVKFNFKGDGGPLIKTSQDLFDNKRVVLFSLPWCLYSYMFY